MLPSDAYIDNPVSVQFFVFFLKPNMNLVGASTSVTIQIVQGYTLSVGNQVLN